MSLLIEISIAVWTFIIGLFFTKWQLVELNNVFISVSLPEVIKTLLYSTIYH